MLRRPTTSDHNWATRQVDYLLKTIYLNWKLYHLKLCPALLKDMNVVEYRAYAKILESLLKS